MMKVKTNWINLLGVFVSVTLYSTIFNYTDPQTSRTIIQSFIASLILVIGYGMIFWLPFVVALIVLDYFLIPNKVDGLRYKLILQWMIISAPFIYWMLKYSEWIFLIAIATFLITQLIRERLIKEDFNA
jgi:hypothetical protein